MSDKGMHRTWKHPDRLGAGFIRAFFVLLFAFTGESAIAQTASITFDHKERALKPGEVVIIEAGSTRPLETLQIEVFGHKFTASDEGGGRKWSGLIGIDLETRPGRYRVKLTGSCMDGKIVTAQKAISINAKTFPTRKLVVEEKYVNPSQEDSVRIRDESKRVQSIFASVTPKKLWKGSFHAPVPGEVISVFGKRNLYNGQPRSPHSGVDFRGKKGTPIHSPNAGRVVLAGDLYYSGNTVIIDHGLGLYSYLGHMSEISVKEGDSVETGDIIGKVGATGRVTGPHLHWTIRLVTTRVDPISLISVLSGS